ncbi:hypothetical protein M747DRAFT_21957 [Aspergillus niger ATCC 13496]|uniref:Uncharacterized protein n=1 Tax=Aspergillus niger ATCC 13496 TaxID=1353008 RepID=A0A370C7G9_ASPNG|nr:hypothetical protein M747DRAFT_21957 [Aspergillus niger ATCC 13496]
MESIVQGDGVKSAIENECGSGDMEEEEDEGVKGKGETVTGKVCDARSNAREKRKERKRELEEDERVEWKIKIKREKEQRSLWKVWKTRKKRRDLDSFRSSFWLPFIFFLEFTVLVGLFPFFSSSPSRVPKYYSILLFFSTACFNQSQ